MALVSNLRLSVVACLLAALCWVAPLQARAAPPGPSVKITILSTMVTDFGSVDKPTFGEWGFAALVEVQGKKLLFDSGRSPELVLKNALALGIDLSDVEDVVLSHFHMDHTGGLLYLRTELKKQNPRAMSHLHVNKGFFDSRRGSGSASQVEGNQMIAERTRYEAGGGTVHTYAKATELAPGVWLSGPVPRVTQERNWSGSGQVRLAGNWVDDNVPESLSLFVATPEGTIVLSGCGHAGIVNITRHAETVLRTNKLHAAIGGFHLLNLDDDTLAWTARELRKGAPDYFVGAHCTGLEATYALRGHLGLSRKEMVNGAVGASFVYGQGIHATMIAH